MREKISSSGGRRPNTTMLGVAALVLMGMVGVSYHEWRQYSRANADAVRAREIVDSVDALLSSLVNAETGERGFILTGEDRYLEPYNRAAQAIPNQLAHVNRLLNALPGQGAKVARLDSLDDEKLSALRQTIELRRSEGARPALALVLSDQGRRVMDEIRALGAEIKLRENSTQSQTATEREAAAQTALLATVAGSLVLLFLFAIGLEPFASADPQAKQRPWQLRYGAAVLAVVVTVLFRMALTPLVGPTEMPFTLFFPVVWFAAWFGGFRPGLLALGLSALAAAYFFAEPTRTLLVGRRDDQVALLMLVLVGFGMALLSHSQRRAVERATQAENAERSERQRFETTLASIGDAVIATDGEGRVTFVNKIARSLLKAPEAEVLGKPLDDVFRIVNELTRAKVESPVARVLPEGEVVGLANHTVLIARDGTEIPIDDSGAPIRVEGGRIVGTVLIFRDITGRRRAEAVSALLASIVESSEDAIFSKDLNGVVTSWNKGAERIFGYSAQEMIGRPVSLLAAPDHVNEMQEILERIKRGESVDHYRSLRRTKSGKLIHVSVTISPLRNAVGQTTGASTIVRDITAQIEAEAQVAEQRERLQVTLRSIGDAVLATDTAGHVSYLNPVAEHLTGWSSREGVGRPLGEVFQIINEESRQAAENPVTRVLREGATAGLANHTLLISRTGEEVAIDDSAAPIKDAHGENMGVVLIFRSVTEKRAAEKRLAEQAAELRQRAHLMEHTHCFARDLEGRIVYWNPGATDLYGFSAEEAVGQFGHALLKTESAKPLEEIESEVMSKGEWDGELVHTLRNGGRVTVASRWALHRGEDGRPVSILEVNVDITDRKRAEEARHESELSAQLLRIQDEERRRIGRELHDSAGQNLVILKMDLDSLLSSSVPLEALRLKLLECARLADETIKEIRTTSYAMYPPMLEEAGLKSAIPLYLDGLRQRSGMVTQLEISPDFGRPARDVELALFRVLQESLTNVLRHSGSPVADVRVGMKDGMIELEVRDQGKGIPPQVLNAFAHGSPGRLGVGLRGMKERIRHLGGTLRVSSSAAGTIVSVEVPQGHSS